MLTVRKFDAHPTELARLYRKRMVVASETEEGQKLNVSLVKRLTGGDTVTARFMRQDFFEFRPTHKLLMCDERPAADSERRTRDLAAGGARSVSHEVLEAGARAIRDRTTCGPTRRYPRS
jgi:hypothetical protein